MTRAVHVKHAAKDYPDFGIKKGDSYYWWKFRFGGKHYSVNPPRRSQLTQSAYLGTLYDIEDEISNLSPDDSLPGAVEDIVNRLTELRDEQEEKRGNMPEALQDSSSGELLQERYDTLDGAINELEALDFHDAPDSFSDIELPSDEEIAARNDEESEEEYAARLDEEKENLLETAKSEYWDGKLQEVQEVNLG